MINQIQLRTELTDLCRKHSDFARPARSFPGIPSNVPKSAPDDNPRKALCRELERAMISAQPGLMAVANSKIVQFASVQADSDTIAETIEVWTLCSAALPPLL
jgi:hypothetical protein